MTIEKNRIATTENEIICRQNTRLQDDAKLWWKSLDFLLNGRKFVFYVTPTPCPWASAEIFPGGEKRRNFVYPVQVADDAMQVDVHKTLYHFHPHYFVLVEPQFSIFCLKIFSTLRLSVMLFIFIKCLVSTFSSTFYKKS